MAGSLFRMPRLERRGGPGGDNCRGEVSYPGRPQEIGAWALTLRVGEGSSFAGVVGEVRVGCGNPPGSGRFSGSWARHHRNDDRC